MSGLGIKKRGEIRQEQTKVEERTEESEILPREQGSQNMKCNEKGFPTGATKAHHTKLPGLSSP